MELRSARLLLRPFRADDQEQFSAFVDDPAYRRFLGPNHPNAEQLVANNVAVDWQREHSWVICLDGDVVGSIFLGVDLGDQIAELACLLSPSIWGQDIAGEASRAVVDYAFGKLDYVGKVFARAAADNAASRRAMEKAGMLQEGLLRAHRLDVQGNRVDEVLYGFTREDWAVRTEER